MIHLGDKEVVLISLGGKVISSIYRGATLVWQAVRSCFGAGFWKNEAQWSNNEGWKN